MKKIFTFFLLTIVFLSGKISVGQNAVYLSNDPSPSTFVNDSRARNGITQSEAVMITPGNPAGVKLNPSGNPVWIYGAYYMFEFRFDPPTGTSTWKIDFNRDGDFNDPQEVASSVSSVLIHKGFKYVDVKLQGTNASKYVTVQNLTINGTNFGTLSSPASGQTLQQLYQSYNGLFTNILVSGTLMFSAGTDQEFPHFLVQAADSVNIPKIWNGSVNNDWNNAANWDDNAVPAPMDDILIPVGSPMPVLPEGEVSSCSNLVVATGGSKSALGDGLKISGDLNINGSLTIPATGSVDVTHTGTLTVNQNLLIEGNMLIEDNGSVVTLGLVLGNATVQQDIPNDMSWHFLSSPVSGQAICNGVFAPTLGTFPGNITTWDFYNWLPNCPTPPSPAEHWRNLRTSGGTVNTVDFPGLTFWVTRGYLVSYGAGWSTTRNFYGPLNCCNQICTFYDVVDVCSWALAGNPYPSAIDWRLIPGKTNLLSDYYYIWNENKSGGAGYEYWKDDSHFSSTMVNGYIATAQGFFVKVDPNGSLSLTIPDAARTHHATTWLKSDQTPVNRLSIKLNNGNKYDMATVMFENNSSAGKDRSDAEKLFSLDTKVPQVYSIIDNDQKTSLNTMPYVDNGITIPIGFLAPSEGIYNISVSGIETFSSLAGLTLEDLKLNCSQNLLQNPVYYFSSDGIEDAGRFLLHFAGPIGIGEKNNSNVNIYSNEKTVFVTCANGFHNSVVTVINLLGQDVLSQKLIDQPINQVNVNAPQGYYIVKVQDGAKVKTAKVFIQ